MAIIKPNNNTISAITALPAAIETGSLVKLAETTISADSASVSFDGYFTSTYNTYFVVLNSVVNDTSGQTRFRVRQSNADKTDSNYFWTQNTIYSSGEDNNVNTADNNVAICNTQSIGRNFGTYATMYIHNPLNSSIYKLIHWQSANIYWSGSAEFIYTHTGHTIYKGNTSALSGFTFYPATGNFDSGTITLYGVQ